MVPPVDKPLPLEEVGSRREPNRVQRDNGAPTKDDCAGVWFVDVECGDGLR
jgi:hypothetical protein